MWLSHTGMSWPGSLATRLDIVLAVGVCNLRFPQRSMHVMQCRAQNFPVRTYQLID